MKYFAAKGFVELGGILYSKLPSRRTRKYDLVLVRTDRIGDYVIWHDTIAAYKQRYPNKKVLLICNDSIESLAKEERFFTEIFCYNINKIKKNLKYALNFINLLKNVEADVLVNSIWERIWYADIFSLSVKAKKKIAISPKKAIGTYINYYNRQYSELFDCNHFVSEIEADEEFVQKAIWQDYSYGNYSLEVKANNNSIITSYVVISFSTSTAKKNWPLIRFSNIIDFIPKHYKIVLIGAGAFDENCAKQIVASVADSERILNYVGKTTIPEMVSIISRASFVISNDSAAVHIASSVKTPSIAILSGAEYGRFLPYPARLNIKNAPVVVSVKMDCMNCKYKCVYPNQEPLECVNRVTVDMVKQEIEKVLENIRENYRE